MLLPRMLLRWGNLWRWLRIGAAFGALWMVWHIAYPTPIDPYAFSVDMDRHDSCRPYGWKPYRKPTSNAGVGRSWGRSAEIDSRWEVDEGPPRKVYDLLMINTELDWLEIRLNSTWNTVDYYVLVEGRKTFTNLDKPLVLRDNLARFAPYESKIIYHEIQYPLNFQPRSTWDMEDLQRNSMLTQVFPLLQGAKAPNLGDVIVVSDVDEIPRPTTFAVLRDCAFPRRLTLRSRFYYYSFQWRHRGAEEWAHPQATYYEGPIKTLRPNDLRIGDGGWWPFNRWESADMPNAAWHCSSCFETMEELLTKMRSFAHVSMNAAQYRDRARIADRIRRGKDLWDRPGEEYDRIENNTDVPSFLLQNKARFRYMLDRDGPNAGFTDYHAKTP
ncbi:glycosyltransferase family 17 protein [Podospora didyma]|uniref:Glycosyltransferase family 17 protein n=1 Tax=Podospora didyma TaxID=330526 RepID=A0AAE0U7J3_9PEZI|nr:glycosyltransferase family 17 protein [Podospora didyma]